MAEGNTPLKTEDWLKLVRPYQGRHRSKLLRFSAQDSALLVIDMQRYFLDEKSHAYLPMAKDIVENVRSIIESYRTIGRPVVFTRHALREGEDPGMMEKWWGDTLMDDNPMSEIVSGLTPLPEDLVVRKTRYSAFIGTALDKGLTSLGVRRVLITGVMTHLCCESTAREAFMRDYEVFVVVDGTASADETLHISSLMTMTDGFAMPVTTKEVLQCARG